MEKLFALQPLCTRVMLKGSFALESLAMIKILKMGIDDFNEWKDQGSFLFFCFFLFWIRFCITLELYLAKADIANVQYYTQDFSCPNLIK